MLKNETIQLGIRRGFENNTSKLADRICYGYKKTSGGNLIINEREAEIVRMIFNCYLSGESLDRIVDKLEVLGVCSPSGKKKWSRQAVDKILSNEKYTGGVELQKTIVDGGRQRKNSGDIPKHFIGEHHPPIIEQGQFDAVQKEKMKASLIALMGYSAISARLP